METTLFRLAGTLLFLQLLVSPAYSASPWRYWNKSDGLIESWVFGLTSDADGHVIVKHGEVMNESVLDGYRIKTIPSQHAYGRLLSPPHTGTAENELWTFDTEGILIHDASGWHKYPDNEIAEFAKSSKMALIPWYLYSISSYRGAGQNDRMDVVPIGNSSAIIMFPDRLVEWNRTTKQKRLIQVAAQSASFRFLDVQGSPDGSLWLTGEKGLGHLKIVLGDGSAPYTFEWHDWPAPARLTELKSPMPGRDGEVFLSALHPNGRRGLFRVKSSEWAEIFVGGSEALKGWRGPDNAIWVQRGDQLMQLDGSPDASPTRAVANGMTGVVDLPHQGFWVATTEGIGRYSPALWRTPSGAEWIDAPVNAITGDKEGRVWFLTKNFLVVNDHEKWRRYQLPVGQRSALLIDTMLVAGNGDLVMRADSLAETVAFNPGTEKFRFVRHPDGKRTGFIARRAAGSIWIQVFENDGIRWRLQAYDGTGFQPVVESFPFLTVTDLRLILETHDGKMWIGTPGSLSLLENGALRTIGVKDGFTDSGVFSAVETADRHVFLGGRESVTEYDGKSFHIVKGIDLGENMSLGRDGAIWTASGSGVHRYQPGKWITNAVDDGLPSAAVHDVYSDFQGRVWAGTSRGLSLFYPDADTDPPLTNIADGRNLRKTPPGGEVRLAFSGVDKWKFTSPDRLTFSWRLDNSTWSDFDQSQFASFTGLSSGGHLFEVRSMDRNGNVDPQAASFQFTVLTPWYNATGFYVVAALGLFAVLFLLRTAATYHGNLKFQSRHDPLTRLPNRLEFEDVLSTTVVQARSPAVMFIDLDGFKQVNDLYGHKAGDALLKQVSLRIGSCIRPSDTLARIGGDEFTIVMPLMDRDRAAIVADRILVSMRDSFLVDGHLLELTASVGIGLCPDHGNDATTLLRLADIAMYQSKANNKNCYRFYDSSMEDSVFRKSEIVALLRSSLKDDGFSLVYQPIIDTTGAVVEMEALARMNTSSGVAVPPNEFIRIAEETGLIHAVGDRLFAIACGQARIWQDAGFDIRLAINISPIQLESADFVQRTLQRLEASGLPGSSLVMEITETAIIRSREQAHAAIQELRAAGIGVALDDFGTGYSSLSILANLPVDCVKIDRSFTAQLTRSSRTLDLVGETVRLAHKLGLGITAEGVEEQTQLDILREIGCDLIQGYLIAPPLTPGDATELLAGLPSGCPPINLNEPAGSPTGR